MSMKGIKHSSETKRKISQALKGRKFSGAHRRHLSEGRMGKANPFYAHKHTYQHKQMISQLLTGRVPSGKTRRKMAQAKDGLYNGEKNPFFGKHHSPETKSKLSLIRKELYAKNPELLKRWLTFRRPNKTEEILIGIMERNNLPFKYVGDGDFILGGKCPDFLNVNGKKQLIELFGAHWHPIFDIARRKEHFKQYGFQTLIIWEDELKVLPEADIVKRIRKFSLMKEAKK